MANVIPFNPAIRTSSGNPPMPTPSRDAYELGREITNFCKQTDYAKAQWNAWADTTESYHRGDMWRYLIRQTLNVRTDPALINGPFDNSFAIATDIMNSTIMGAKMVSECVPTGNDMHSRKSANTGTAVIRDHDDRNRVSINRHVLSLMLLLNGLRYKRVSFDPSQLGTITLPPEQLEQWERETELPAFSADRMPDGRIQATYAMGGTMEHDVHGGCVLVDPGVENWSDVVRFAVVEYPSVFATRQKYEHMQGAIQPVYVVDNRNYGAFVYNGIYQFYKQDSTTGHRFSPISNVTRTVEYWQKAKTGLWDRILCTGENNEYVLAEDHNIIDNPYVCYTARTGDSLYRLAKPPAQAMVDPQYLGNSYIVFGLTYFRKCPKDIIWVPDGSDDSTGDFSSDFVQRKTFSSLSGKPEVSRMESGTLDIIMRQATRFCDDVFRAAGVSPAQRGFAAPRTSGDALEAQIQSADGPLMQIRNNIIAGEEEKGRKILILAKQFYTMPRFMATGVETGIRDFCGADIRGGASVRMRLTGMSSETIAERTEMANMAAQLGLLNPGAEQIAKRWEAIREGTGSAIMETEEERLSFNEADHEYEQMQAGNVTLGPPKPGVEIDMKRQRYSTGGNSLVYADTGIPLISPTDMDEFHMDRHWQQAHDPNCPQPIRNLLNYHMQQEHQVRIQQRQQLA